MAADESSALSLVWFDVRGCLYVSRDVEVFLVMWSRLIVVCVCVFECVCVCVCVCVWICICI